MSTFESLLSEGRVYGSIDLQTLIASVLHDKEVAELFDLRCAEHGYEAVTRVGQVIDARLGHLFVEIPGLGKDCPDVPGVHLVYMMQSSHRLYFQKGISCSLADFEYLVSQGQVRRMTRFYDMDVLLADAACLTPVPPSASVVYDLHAALQASQLFVSTDGGLNGLGVSDASVSTGGDCVRFKLWRQAQRRVNVTVPRLRKLLSDGSLFAA